MVSLFVPSLNEVAVALADPGDDSPTLSIAECKAVLAEGDGAEHVSGFLVGQSTTMVFEATATATA